MSKCTDRSRWSGNTYTTGSSTTIFNQTDTPGNDFLEPDDVAAADAQVASEEGPEEDVDDLLGDEQLGGLVELVAASYE